MPQFPNTEIEILALALEMRNGLVAHTEVFPAPPVLPAAMTTVLDQFQVVMENVTTARSQAEALTGQKLDVLSEIADQIKKNLKYAETVAGDSDDKLKLIGWGTRKTPTPTVPPGQTRNLVVYPQSEGWLELQWMAPAEGDKPTMYRVQRRLRASGKWELIASVFERKITLQNQPRGVELEYSVIAANKAGDGPVSNTVMVVL